MSVDPAHEHWMQRALALARQAAEQGEVPVGAVLTHGRGDAEELLASAHNQPIGRHDPTAHAEVQVLREGARVQGNYRLPDTTLYVTLEPCMMCAGALVHARVARLVIGAREPKSGAVLSHPQLHQPWLNHQIEVIEGVLADACGALLTDFFAARRLNRRG